MLKHNTLVLLFSAVAVATVTLAGDPCTVQEAVSEVSGPIGFKCDFVWTNRDGVLKEILRGLKERFKVLFYFKSHMKGFTNPQLNYSNNTVDFTWVWVLKDYKYLLHYPHNFYTLSLITVDIITEEIEIKGKCNETCTKVVGHESCGPDLKEMFSLLTEATNSTAYKWEKLCFHASVIPTDVMKPHAYMFLPNLFYYGYFVHALWFTNVTGLRKTKHFPNYHCYLPESYSCEISQIWHHYDIILAMATIVWLYCPLLIYYFPSSNGGQKFNIGFYPSYGTPVHFVKFIRWMLWYYPSDYAYISVRIRRMLFLIFLIIPAFNLDKRTIPLYPSHVTKLFLFLLVCYLIPNYLSKWIAPKHPSCFPLVPYLATWHYNSGFIRKSETVEYQLLANIMEERFFLLFNYQFWHFVWQNSYNVLGIRQSALYLRCPLLIQYTLSPILLYLRIVICLRALFVTMVYFIIPLPYFVKEVCYAIIRGEKSMVADNSNYCLLRGLSCMFAICHGLGMLLLFIYILLALFFYSLLFTELTIYTLIGCILTPDKAYRYVVLVSAFVGAIYFLINQLHGSYSDVLNDVIKMLSDKLHFALILKDLRPLTEKVKLVRKDNEEITSQFSIVVVPDNANTEPSDITKNERILITCDDGITTLVCKELFHSIMEHYTPLRKKVVLILMQISIMIFYIVVTMQAKNVYHLEKNVSGIFGLAQALAITFLPALITFLGFKNRLGKKKEDFRKVQIHKGILNYIAQCKFPEPQQ